MARRPPPSAAAIAIERLGKLASVGTGAARVERDARAILAAWEGQHDAETVRQLISETHAEIASGLVAAEEQLDDVDASEAGALKHVQAVVAALRAAEAVLRSGG